MRISDICWLELTNIYKFFTCKNKNVFNQQINEQFSLPPQKTEEHLEDNLYAVIFVCKAGNS